LERDFAPRIQGLEHDELAPKPHPPLEGGSKSSLNASEKKISGRG
jgi:hypothetical protein